MRAPNLRLALPPRRRPISEVVGSDRLFESRSRPDPTVESPMAQVRALAKIVAASSISVLLLGPTGAGKEVLAESIHDASPRRLQPLVKLNCAALPEQLVESELFGHERGVFTGASRMKRGLLESATGGTIFLDEVADLSFPMQAKLLRALDAKEVVRGAALSPSPLDVRFIAATSRDLGIEVAEGRFREDLFYRLNGITLVVPALAQRRDEILALAQTFAAGACAALGQPPKTFHPRAVAALYEHDWPGNIRELRSVVERACVLCPGDAIEPEHVALARSPSPVAPRVADTPLPSPPRVPRDLEAFSLPPRSAERDRILRALDQVAGNQSRAARLLGMSRSTLLRRLDMLDLPRPRKS